MRSTKIILNQRTRSSKKIAAGDATTKIEVLDAPGQISVDKQALLSFVADAPVVKLVNQILSEAVKARAQRYSNRAFLRRRRGSGTVSNGILRQIQVFPQRVTYCSRLPLQRSCRTSISLSNACRQDGQVPARGR